MAGAVDNAEISVDRYFELFRSGLVCMFWS